MGLRQHYFCDWCAAESPQVGSTPYDWKRSRDVSTGADELICGACVAAVTKAVANAKKERRTPQAKEKDSG